MNPATPPAQPRDEFFIGWLRMPPSYRKFLLPVSLLLLVAVIAIGLVAAAGQGSPGTAAWDSDKVLTFDGIIYSSPYAMLRVAGEKSADPPRTIFLVEEGKFGAAQRVQPWDGQSVRVTGTLLHRDERWMLELAEGEKGIWSLPTMSEKEQRRLRLPAPRPIGQMTLRGEIIDSKCHLGAMKPGGGKTHKCCAVLCISGGIPPMFVTRDANKRETYYLLTGPSGEPAGGDIRDFIGDPVEITAPLQQQGDLLVLCMSAANIRRR